MKATLRQKSLTYRLQGNGYQRTQVASNTFRYPPAIEIKFREGSGISYRRSGLRERRSLTPYTSVALLVMYPGTPNFRTVKSLRSSLDNMWQISPRANRSRTTL